MGVLTFAWQLDGFVTEILVFPVMQTAGVTFNNSPQWAGLLSASDGLLSGLLLLFSVFDK